MIKAFVLMLFSSIFLMVSSYYQGRIEKLNKLNEPLTNFELELRCNLYLIASIVCVILQFWI